MPTNEKTRITPGYKSDLRQLTLFDKSDHNLARFRNLAGDLAERLSCKLTGARRLKTDATAEICPDLHVRENLWIETKSVGVNRTVIIYQHRFEKESRFIKSGEDLVYLIWSHGSRAADTDTQAGATIAYLENLRSVTILNHEAISKIVDGGSKAVRQVNNAYYSNHGRTLKGLGWVLQMSAFDAQQIDSVQVNEITVPVMATFFGGKDLIVSRKINLRP